MQIDAYYLTLRSALIGISFIVTSLDNVLAQQSVSDSYDDPTTAQQYPQTMDDYCVTCHNETLMIAGLMLDKVNVDDISQDPLLWEKVLLKLNTRTMPPVGMPRPDESFYESFASYLEQKLDSVAAANINPGRTVSAHRLNRNEFSNAVRDLLGLEFDGVSLLPADNSGDFDNLGDLLSVSQVLMERYMSAARNISQLAIGDQTIDTDGKIYTISPLLLQNDRMSEDLPFGSRGGIAVKHRFPLDGDYEIKIRLQRSDQEALIIGIAEPHRLDVRVDGVRIKLFKFGGNNRGLAQADDGMSDPFQSEYERTADDALVIRFPAQAGTRLVQVAFLEEDYAWEGQVPPPSYDNFFKARLGETSGRAWAEPAVSSIAITGPFNASGAGNTTSRGRIFICMPKGEAEEGLCARNILGRLGHLAYRRPVTPGDLEPLLNLYGNTRNEGGTFEAGIQMALEGLLTSPGFLFRIEHNPVGAAKNTVYPINNLELASRLSFFLWSSIPDEELLNIAELGKLSEPTVLEQQVIRMLKDDRSDALMTNFAEQWLLLRNLPYTDKNQELFPDFDENLRMDLQKETNLFVASIFQEDRSILDLFRADYKFLNERLARHYDIADVYGNKFRRVSVDDENKKGLLAQGSILAITSYPNRTSPVLRGKWVLENILAAPPPPPPPNIPDLKEEDEGGKTLSMREAIEKHRASPVCAVCHNQMDPIGFGLENFNPIGQWRTEDAGQPIDSSGMLPDGSMFQGPAQLQMALLKQSGVIASAFTQKLLTYALGRDLEYYDMAVVRKIVNNAADDDYRFSNFVLGIVNSLPFQMRRTGP